MIRILQGDDDCSVEGQRKEGKLWRARVNERDNEGIAEGRQREGCIHDKDNNYSVAWYNIMSILYIREDFRMFITYLIVS